MTRNRIILCIVALSALGVAGLAQAATGPARARLALRFARARRAMPPAIDDGVSPVSWKAWLAELDRQHLALKVSSQKTPDFEFVERQDASSGAPLN